MKVRMIMVPLVALAVSATAAHAQQQPAPPPPAGQGQGGGGGMGRGQGGGQRRMQALMQGITLTPAQQASVDSLTTAFRAKMPAFTPGTPPDSATRAQMMQVSQQRDAAIRAVLTPEQQHTWDTNMVAVQAQMQQMQQQPRP
jgi:Spy/CpxP family protein refolding chaperone